MIRSMTGYGSAKGTAAQIELTIELKSVNNRYLDCNIKIPRIYSYCEDAMKSRIQAEVTRGKLDVYVTVDSANAGDVDIQLNRPLLEAYIAAYRRISEEYGVPDTLDNVTLARLPEVLTLEKKEVDVQTFSDELIAILQQALDAFNAMREREGEKLREDILRRLDEMERLSGEIALRSPQSVADYRKKLEQRMAEVLANVTIDESRILTEAAIFADKVAINEELVRLASHVSQTRALLSGGSAIGRKLDFIVQEMNREVNTIGSKCNDLEITHYVVDLKAEIEKIREQAQNIE